MTYPSVSRQAVALRSPRLEVLERTPPSSGPRPAATAARSKVRLERSDVTYSFNDTAPPPVVDSVSPWQGLRLTLGNISGLPADFVFGEDLRFRQNNSYPVAAIEQLIEDLRKAGIGNASFTYDLRKSRGIDVWAKGFDSPAKYPGVASTESNVYLIGPARGLDPLVDLTMDQQVIPRFYAKVSEAQSDPAYSGDLGHYLKTHPLVLVGMVLGGLIAMCVVKKILECCAELSTACGEICSGASQPDEPRSRVEIEVVDPGDRSTGARSRSRALQDGLDNVVQLHPMPRVAAPARALDVD